MALERGVRNTVPKLVLRDFNTKVRHRLRWGRENIGVDGGKSPAAPLDISLFWGFTMAVTGYSSLGDTETEGKIGPGKRKNERNEIPWTQGE